MVVLTPGPLPLWIYRASSRHEDLHGPLPDVVETQGRFLIPQPRTPVDPAPDHDLVEEIQRRLEYAALVQTWRDNKYGPAAAEEWPHRHTPPHVRQAYADKQKALRDKWDAYVSPDDSSDGGPIPWSPHFQQAGTPPSSSGSSFPQGPSKYHKRSVFRNTPPKTDMSKWIYPGIWHGWEEGSDEPNPRKRRLSDDSDFPRVRKRRFSDTSDDIDAAGEADDESRPRRRQKRETIGNGRGVSAAQRERDAGLAGDSRESQESPRRSARLKSIKSSPCATSNPRKTLYGRRTGLVRQDPATGDAQDGFRPRRSARLKSMSSKSSPHGLQSQSRTRQNGRRRTNITMLHEAG